MAGTLSAKEAPESLSCSGCLQPPRNAVGLGCGHWYCRACIDQQAPESGEDSAAAAAAASCPICLIASLKKTKTPGTCEEHDEKLKLFCKDDGMLACVVCSLSQKHCGHRFQPIQEAVSVYKEELTSVISPLESKLKSEEDLLHQQERILRGHEGIQDFLESTQQKQEKMMADSSVVVSSSLSRRNFRGPIQYAVWKSMKRDILPDVSPLTLDLNTAHPNLVLSNSCTCVAHSFKRQKVPNNPERFQGRLGVLGSEGFAREKPYWEVDVGEKTAWEVGVVKESIDRKSSAMQSCEEGYIVLYWPGTTLNIGSQKIGVYLDYEAGQVSFYIAEVSKKLPHIWTYSHTFHERLYPYFSPGSGDEGRNIEPLRIFHSKV